MRSGQWCIYLLFGDGETFAAAPEEDFRWCGHHLAVLRRVQRALEQVDGAVFIPMYGKGGSLNVHVALAVVLFHVLHRRALPD